MLAASLLPLINVFSFGEEAPWYLWVPALAQNVLMTHVLKGEAFNARTTRGADGSVCAAGGGRRVVRRAHLAQRRGTLITAMTVPPPPSTTWRWCRFDELGVRELDAIYRARQQVFSIEQACIYLDADGFDVHSFHLAAWGADRWLPLAYARVVHPGHKYAEPSIGRVITTSSARGSGLGRELVRRSVAHCGETFPGQAIRISAQTRLERFYGEFGFAAVGTPYMEDGIPHTEMLRPG